MSESEKKSKFPEPPTPAGNSVGNLLSSVAPPMKLPNFVTPSPILSAPEEKTAEPAPASTVNALPSVLDSVPVAIPAPIQATGTVPDLNIKPPMPVQPVLVQARDQPQHNNETFSPVIPLSKGQPTLSIRSPEESQASLTPESLPDSSQADKLGDIMPGSGLLTWMKGAVSTGGILHQVAEKAKSTVDSMITTLDPQMREYLRSGGDLLIVVASDKDNKISPIREAFQAIFGKANVIGYPAQSDVTAAQPVGYAAAYAAAKQRIAHIRSVHTEINNNVPVVAIEGFLHEAVPDKWYDLSLLVLSQPSLGVELSAQSQGTGVPCAAVSAARAATPADYAHAQTGFSVTIGAIMADSLHVPHTEWQEAATGVSRREVLHLAARSLAGSYKKLLAISANES